MGKFAYMLRKFFLVVAENKNLAFYYNGLRNNTDIVD